MPPSAVTSTSSIIIILTLVHPFATSWPSSPKGDARTLRDLLSVSYGKITILLTGSLRSPPPIRLCHWARLRCEGSEGSKDSKGGGGALRAQSSYMAPNLAGGQRTADSCQPTADSGRPPANACYPAKGTLKGISIQNTHASMTWFSKSAAGVIVEGAGRKDVSFPIISFEEAYYGELQSL